ncbi:hypothetical protein C7S18_16360 [Ahniella affigens]|uniref:Glycosyl transferase family 1 domain-containing protein n=2 Tax=Ahniella affigens TaxID=2021234 RepID=A0A2P1PV11_9GAMM|nr:hypothetical protein C7S18_16360 [Ahniella affigens]
MTRPLKILIPMHGFVVWGGGIDLLAVIVKSLRAAAPSENVQLLYAVPNSDEGISAESAAARARVRAFMQDGQFVPCETDARGLNLAAVESGADVIFPNRLPIRTQHVHRVGYIYDFQHRDRPDWFSAEERAERDEEFGELVRRSDAMYCTSQVVAEGLMRYYGIEASRILVMPYTSYVDPDWFQHDPIMARAQFGIGSNYLMVCNHFWIHKDHRTVIDAFAALVQRPEYSDFELVLTGDTNDFRDPTHYPKLQAHIEALGISARCHRLGFVPKSTQLALLRGARMLIQPTLYEGAPGGGASYEAIGLGILTLLSDIPVNLEVKGEGVRWFKAGDPVDLCHQMCAALEQPRDHVDDVTLIARSHKNLANTGRVLIRFLRQLVAS